MTKITKVRIISSFHSALRIHYVKDVVNVNITKVIAKVKIWVGGNHLKRQQVLNLKILKTRECTIQDGKRKTKLIDKEISKKYILSISYKVEDNHLIILSLTSKVFWAMFTLFAIKKISVIHLY